MSLLGRQLQGTNRRSPPGTFVNGATAASPPHPGSVLPTQGYASLTLQQRHSTVRRVK